MKTKQSGLTRKMNIIKDRYGSFPKTEKVSLAMREIALKYFDKFPLNNKQAANDIKLWIGCQGYSISIISLGPKGA